MWRIFCAAIFVLGTIATVNGRLINRRIISKYSEEGAEATTTNSVERTNIGVTAVHVGFYNITIDKNEAKKPLTSKDNNVADVKQNKDIPVRSVFSEEAKDKQSSKSMLQSQVNGADNVDYVTAPKLDNEEQQAVATSGDNKEDEQTTKPMEGEESETTGSSENEEPENTVECSAGAECYLDRDCGKGNCLGGRRCNCLGCPALLKCKNDKDCGGFNEACDIEKGICNCEKGAQAAGFDNYFGALSTLCQTECISSEECYGLRCTPGMCICQ